MSEDGTTNNDISLKWRYIVRILPTYKTLTEFAYLTCVKCVTKKCVGLLCNCVTAGERFVLELPISRAMLATSRPLVFQSVKGRCHGNQIMLP